MRAALFFALDLVQACPLGAVFAAPNRRVLMSKKPVRGNRETRKPKQAAKPKAKPQSDAGASAVAQAFSQTPKKPAK
jgi:hypothetical protein